MNRQSRRRKAMRLSQMGLLIVCLAWPLGESYHTAVQFVLLLISALIAGWAALMLSRLVSEQEKHIMELENQLNTGDSNRTR